MKSKGHINEKGEFVVNPSIPKKVKKQHSRYIVQRQPIVTTILSLLLVGYCLYAVYHGESFVKVGITFFILGIALAIYDVLASKKGLTIGILIPVAIYAGYLYNDKNMFVGFLIISIVLGLFLEWINSFKINIYNNKEK